MTYMIERADKVATQLEKFSTGYAHHVVGQHANLEFWIGEAKHALDALEFRTACTRLDTSVDLADLKRE